MATSILRISALLFALAVVPAGICNAQALPGTASQRLAALDADGDGLLSRYEYDSDAALAAMDSDHNDRITPAELQAFLGREEAGAESASYRLSVVDQDGDGELTDRNRQHEQLERAEGELHGRRAGTFLKVRDTGRVP